MAQSRFIFHTSPDVDAALARLARNRQCSRGAVLRRLVLLADQAGGAELDRAETRVLFAQDQGTEQWEAHR